MKNKNIYGIILAAALVLAGSCTKERDMSDVDKWLGEYYNQECKWDMDSITFHRAEWTSQAVIEGVQMRKTQAKIKGFNRSISYISYSPDEFKTYVGYSEQGGTVEEVAAAQSGALFAISGVSSAANYFKYNGSVVSSSTADASQVNGVLAISNSLNTNMFSIYNCEDGNYSSISEDNAMATGAVLVAGGKEMTFPAGDYYDTRKARSIIGYDFNTGNYIFATIDKSADGTAEGSTIAEAAFFARMMGMTEAVCLADGDAATIWSKDEGVLNVPSSATPTKVSSVVYVGANVPALDGKGTAEEPYIIDMAVKMKQMRAYAPAGGETYFKLTQDINMSSTKTWYPVNWDGEFNRKVHFDGNGKTIANFSPNAFVDNATGAATNYPSLFGVLYGSCKDLTIKDSKITTAKSSAGFIGGYIGTSGKPGLVENVHLVNCEIDGTGNTYGGFGGNGREATIKNCSADIVIRAAGPDVGGFIGLGQGTIEIENCTAEVDLAAQKDPGGNMRYGGIVGYHKGTTISIKNSSASGLISCGYSCNTSGGILAYSGSTTSTLISQCKSSVDLKNDTGKSLSNSGGMVGNHGSAGTCTIEDCYATGDLVVNQRCGGIVGAQENGTVNIINSYTTSTIDGYSGLGSVMGVVTKAAGTLKLTNCIGWSASIKSARPDNSKWCCGGLVGSVEGKLTATGCVRTPDMTFTDAVRTLTTHADINNSTPEGTANNHPFDGRPSADATVSAAAATAGWSTSIWDLSGDLPELKIFK
ncbi:MAG: phosphodiester glycosidase family protein [Bacteroidales bacterium]|nr:phosphodiester glycosidase family protein [Bacteroidales bacterium]